jgi:selenocysteine-specific elongation factor
MLVGAGEIDACLLAVAADDGPRAQTWEHLGLLDAMGIERGLVAITKCDLVEARRTEEVSAMMRAAVDRSRLAGAPIIPVSATTGAGLAALRRALAALRDEVSSQSGRWRHGDVWLAIDRAFTIRGRGVVITGSRAACYRARCDSVPARACAPARAWHARPRCRGGQRPAGRTRGLNVAGLCCSSRRGLVLTG